MNNDIRNLTKWLNEEQETPIDRQALARVLAMAEQPAQQRELVTTTCRDSFLSGYEAAQADAKVCDLPPHGWHCTRNAGHEGPCAAVKTDDHELVAHAMKRLADQPAQGCDYCNHPQYAGTKCKNCGREQPAQSSKPFDTHAAPGQSFDTHSRTPQRKPLTVEEMAKALPRPWPDEGDRVCLSPTELRQFAHGITKGNA